MRSGDDQGGGGKPPKAEARPFTRRKTADRSRGRLTPEVVGSQYGLLVQAGGALVVVVGRRLRRQEHDSSGSRDRKLALRRWCIMLDFACIRSDQCREGGVSKLATVRKHEAVQRPLHLVGPLGHDTQSCRSPLARLIGVQSLRGPSSGRICHGPMSSKGDDLQKEDSTL